MFLINVKKEDNIYTSWCRDIRFNYRDRQVFIPYYTHEVFEYEATEKDKNNPFLDVTSDNILNVRYNFELKKYVIMDDNIDYSLDSIAVYSWEEEKVYRISLKGLNYLDIESFSMLELSARYDTYAYIISDDLVDNTWKSYLPIRKKINRRERSIRSKFSLPTYTENYLDMNYVDVRRYEVDAFSPEVEGLPITKPNWLKAYEFEAYLYSIFAQGLDPIEEEYKKPFKELGVTRRHLTIVGRKPLILKYYYTNKKQIRKKTYEMYTL